MDDKLLTAAIGFGAAIIGGLITSVLGPFVKHWLDRRTAAQDRALKRYTEVYSPLVALLLHCHITTVSFSYRNSLKYRFDRARRHLSERKFRAALRTLFAKEPVRQSTEVEFGSYPREKVIQLVKAHAQLADPQLITLVHFAERSTFECYGEPPPLTGAESDLVNYIHDRHTYLAKKFG